jgi:hypothetical protein
MPKLISIDTLLGLEFDKLNLSPEWHDLVGDATPGGAWLIWGNSNNGKSYFSLQVAKELSRLGKLVYYSFEMGLGATLRTAAEKLNLSGAKIYTAVESFDEIKARLTSDKKIKFVIVDSLQYLNLKYEDYKEFKKEFFDNRLLILISHAEGKEPKNENAKAMRYDADVKIWVEGYKAFANTRFDNAKRKPYTIWHQEAAKYWVE